MVLGNSPDSTITISAVREDKGIIIIGQIRQGLELANDRWKWRYFWNFMPPGLNMLVIEGTRSPSSSSGFAIDDLRLRPCSELQGEPWCCLPHSFEMVTLPHGILQKTASRPILERSTWET